MLVLGIDPGTATTGYGFIRDVDDGPVVVAYGVILTPAGAPMPLRLLTIFREIRQLIVLHHPDNVAVEKLFFARNVRLAIRVSQAQRVALLAVALAGLS